MDDAEFQRWVRLLESRTGVTVPPERKPFLETGLRRRMREAGFSSYAAYYEELMAGARGQMEWVSLVDHLTVHETRFFRHPPSLSLIRDQWLPTWLAQAPADQSLHALSVGCSTGEEAYTLAMVLDEALDAQLPPRRFGITATDVSQAALAVARTAWYPKARLAEIPEAYREHAVESAEAGGFRVVERLRRRIGFACVNLLHATRAPLRQLDLIYCQNVLIYFARERRGELLDGLARLLRPNGLLVLGAGEVLGWNHPQLTRTSGRQTLAFLRNS
ncbi:CheR family methyltransferase [Aquimonas voraii]|nr:CheR family methyltransferase [Aquimonas voraii]